MALEVYTPATILDIAELGGARTPLAWAVAREMHAGGQTFAGRVDGKLVVLCGLYRIDDAGAEAWFSAAPVARRHMLAIVRAIRLTLQASGYREIVTVVRTKAGRRIARAAGFSPFGQTDLGEVWKWETCSGAIKAQSLPSSRRRRSKGEASPSSPSSRRK